jgi:hypothetical protein
LSTSLTNQEQTNCVDELTDVRKDGSQALLRLELCSPVYDRFLQNVHIGQKEGFLFGVYVSVPVFMLHESCRNGLINVSQSGFFGTSRFRKAMSGVPRNEDA